MMKTSNRKGVEALINQVTLVGRLTKNPELKTTMDGTPVTQITLAVNRNFRNHHGEVDTDFVQCTLWRKAAENTYHYCRKGAVLGITGRLQTRHYDNREGKRVYVTEVVAESVRFLSSRPQAAAAGAQRPPANAERSTIVTEPHAALERPAEAELHPPATDRAAMGTNQHVAESPQLSVDTQAAAVEQRKEESVIAF